MSIRLEGYEDSLLLVYEPERDSADWLDKKLKSVGGHTFRRTFTVKSQDILRPDSAAELDEELRYFAIGKAEGAYWRINKDVLGLKHDLLFAREMGLNTKSFIAQRDISVFGKIDGLIDEPIVIGGNLENAIPAHEFLQLIKEFPTSTELWRYADVRIVRVLSEYFETMTDAELAFINYAKRRRGAELKSTEKVMPALQIAHEFDLEKYSFVRDRLREMLADAVKYHEDEWQKEVADLFLLIYPQYIAVLQGVSVKEAYSKPDLPTIRKFDLVLVNANGCIDLIEIKTPMKPILRKALYRDNYVPHPELSGGIIQAEKYIFYLNKAGVAIENDLTKKYACQLPSGLEIKVTNPKTIILCGRDSEFTQGQKNDFEFIKRKYSNVMDILTYDDLLRRVENIIGMLQKVQS